MCTYKSKEEFEKGITKKPRYKANIFLLLLSMRSILNKFTTINFIQNIFFLHMPPVFSLILFGFQKLADF